MKGKRGPAKDEARELPPAKRPLSTRSTRSKPVVEPDAVAQPAQQAAEAAEEAPAPALPPPAPVPVAKPSDQSAIDAAELEAARLMAGRGRTEGEGGPEDKVCTAAHAQDPFCDRGIVWRP